MKRLIYTAVSALIIFTSGAPANSASQTRMEFNERVEFRKQVFNNMMKKDGRIRSGKIYWCVWLLIPCGPRTIEKFK